MKPGARRPAPAAVDPRLTPFLDAIAEMLAADELRLAESRRALRAFAKTTSPTTTTKGDRHEHERQARRDRRKK